GSGPAHPVRNITEGAPAAMRGPFWLISNGKASDPCGSNRLRSQLTESLRPLPALNLGWLEALMVIGAPVRGLRPVEAFRRATENVPKPTSRTSSPLESDR